MNPSRISILEPSENTTETSYLPGIAPIRWKVPSLTISPLKCPSPLNIPVPFIVPYDSSESSLESTTNIPEPEREDPFNVCVKDEVPLDVNFPVAFTIPSIR